MARAYYDTYDYPSYWKDRNYEHESELLAIQKLLCSCPKIDSIADIGSGFGRLVPAYLKKAKKICLVEPSSTLLDISKDSFDNFNSKISYICSSIEHISEKMPNESQDLAVMVRVIHHLKDPEESIKIINKVLKRKGFLVLEFANKIHGKAVFRNFCNGDFTFPIDLTPTDRRRGKNKSESVIPFYNYHPDAIKQALKASNFKIIKTLSVSNIRNAYLKKKIPFSLLMKLENGLQDYLSKVYFGPSIFILAQKQ